MILKLITAGHEQTCQVQIELKGQCADVSCCHLRTSSKMKGDSHETHL